MKRSAIRGNVTTDLLATGKPRKSVVCVDGLDESGQAIPDCAALHPGYVFVATPGPGTKKACEA
jgi:hypothetical protein